MPAQEKLDKLSQSFKNGLKIDLTPAVHKEYVKVQFDDGTVVEVPVEEVQKL